MRDLFVLYAKARCINYWALRGVKKGATDHKLSHSNFNFNAGAMASAGIHSPNGPEE